ncbi:hypothetical protein M885DRAFT_615059 [Pelagophyceae sp. CCMP2097]|nr:hypothetical protein M885DRAFT_615059 [Pelagophyceae sp. CCMP2097]
MAFLLFLAVLLARFLAVAGEECPAACTGLATVDLSSWLQGPDGGEALALQRAEAAAGFDAAMRSVGMVCVVGTALAPAAAAALEREAAAFFAQDVQQKRLAGSDWKTYGPEGYTGLGVEAVGRSLGVKAGADAVESFVFRGAPDGAGALCRPADAGGALCDAAAAYWAAMEKTLAALHRLSTAALIPGAAPDDDIFRPKFAAGNGNALKLAHYPATGDEETWRYGEHTDYQTFTLLHLNRTSAKGLEVRGRGGDWAPVGVLDESAIVVNAGDLTEVWTNGWWRSAPHRVKAPAAQPARTAIAFFTGPAGDAVISPILGSGEAAKYEPVEAGLHLARKIGATTV